MMILRVMLASGNYIPGALIGGSMVRMTLLLHLNWEPNDPLPDPELEVSRRTWWAAFLTVQQQIFFSFSESFYRIVWVP